jgi:hypothetical protein
MKSEHLNPLRDWWNHRTNRETFLIGMAVGAILMMLMSIATLERWI